MPRIYFRQTEVQPSGVERSESRTYDVDREQFLREFRRQIPIPGNAFYDLRKTGVASWTELNGNQLTIEVQETPFTRK